MNLYEILVPCTTNEGRPIRTRQHRVWDAKVRALAGGLSIMPPIKGQWVSVENELFAERMIPVRIATTSEVMEQIADMTARFYEQKAIMFYTVSQEVIIKHYE